MNIHYQVSGPLGRHEALSPQASDVLDRDGRSLLYSTSRHGARTSWHTRAPQSRCTRPACALRHEQARCPLVCCIAHCHARPKSDSTSRPARQCKVPLSTCHPSLAQSSATTLSSPPPSTAPMPAGSVPVVWLSDREWLTACLEWLWCRVGLTARHFTTLHTRLTTALHGLVQANDHY